MSNETTDQPILHRVRPQNARVQRGAAMAPREEAEIGDAAEGIGFDAEQRLVRRRRRVDDKFYINPSIIPHGWSYEWKRDSIYGMRDLDHGVNLRENHWRPVPASRHPHMMPLNAGDGPIAKEGMVLMERPKYLTDEAYAEDRSSALEQARGAQQMARSTPSGTFTRDHPSVDRISLVRRSFGPVDAES